MPRDWLVIIRMRKIVACYMTFNSANVIEDSLNSVIDIVDRVVLVDGAFLGHPNLHNHSSDETILRARRRLGSKGIIILAPTRLTEPQTRNLLVQIVNAKFTKAWMFLIDADEVLHNAKHEFRYLRSSGATKYNIAMIRRNDKEYNRMYGLQLYAGLQDRTIFHPRLYKGIPGLHYAENHWTIRDNAGARIETKYSSTHLREAWLEHIREKRSSVELDDMAYYNTYERWKYEKTIRPLRSHAPYAMIKAVKTTLRRGGLNGEAPVNWIYAHTIGSRTREKL